MSRGMPTPLQLRTRCARRGPVDVPRGRGLGRACARSVGRQEPAACAPERDGCAGCSSPHRPPSHQYSRPGRPDKGALCRGPGLRVCECVCASLCTPRPGTGKRLGVGQGVSSRARPCSSVMTKMMTMMMTLMMTTKIQWLPTLTEPCVPGPLRTCSYIIMSPVSRRAAPSLSPFYRGAKGGSRRQRHCPGLLANGSRDVSPGLPGLTHNAFRPFITKESQKGGSGRRSRTGSDCWESDRWVPMPAVPSDCLHLSLPFCEMGIDNDSAHFFRGLFLGRLLCAKHLLVT